MIIEKDKVITISYILKNTAGEILDVSSEESPLVYIHGNENIIPGLEKELERKKVGDKFAAVIKPEDAYGLRSDELMGQVPRSIFEGAGELAIGMQFQAQDEDGSHIVTVTGINGDEISIDENHPLAGITLHFDVTVMDIREATTEEKAAGHIHSGCSCGDDCSHDSCDDENSSCGEGSCGCGCTGS